MTKDQRLRIVFWSVFGFLGMIRAVYGAINGEVFGLVLGLLWCLFGGWKAWTEARRVDEQVVMQKQPDRPTGRR